MTTMATPTTKGCRSDDSVILPGWSVTLVGPSQYPRYTSAVKDGRPWVAQATDKAAKHHMNTTGTRSTAKLSRQKLETQNLKTCNFVGVYTHNLPSHLSSHLQCTSNFSSCHIRTYVRVGSRKLEIAKCKHPSTHAHNS